MDFSMMWETLSRQLGQGALDIVAAMAILLIGWFFALGARVAVRKAAGFAKLNRRLKNASGSAIDLERGAGHVAFWVVLVVALIAFFNMLQLSQVSQPLSAMTERVLTFLPQLLAAAVLAFVAWLLATVLRAVVTRVLAATTLDERLSSAASVPPLSDSAGKVAYGLTLLLFLPAVLDTLELDGLLGPIQGVLDEALGILPNLAAAVVLGLVGWIVARILGNLVTSVLATTGLNAMGERAGLKSGMTLSSVIGTVVFVFVFVPALIGALDALQVEAISDPAKQMLGTFMQAIPQVFAAALVLVAAFLIARFIADVAAGILQGVGVDRVPQALGLPALLPKGTLVSGLARSLLVVVVMLFATIEAAKMLGFQQTSDLVAMFIGFGGQVLLGVAILGLGVWLANLAYGAIARVSRSDVASLAGVVRVIIMALVLAMGLNAMGVADEIVLLAFALPLGSVALAVALSFGLGGREVAARRLEDWMNRLTDNR